MKIPLKSKNSNEVNGHFEFFIMIFFVIKKSTQEQVCI